MQRQIDCYGFEATSEHFQRRKLEAYLVKNDGGIIYECFGNGDPRPRHVGIRQVGGCRRPHLHPDQRNDEHRKGGLIWKWCIL